RGGKLETIAIRERFAPEPVAESEAPGAADAAAAPAPDPNGPSAKTTELKLSEAPVNGATAQSAAGEAEHPEPRPSATDAGTNPAPMVLNEIAGESGAAAEAIETEAPPNLEPDTSPCSDPFGGADLGEVYGRVMALSMTVNHPAFQRALEGFSEGGRVYLVYADEVLKPVLAGGKTLSEPYAISLGIQLCQAIGFAHRRALRLNDICPDSIGIAADGRLRLNGLDYVSNDNELQAEPIFNDGYTAPEIYRGKRVDKRADIFSAGALLYTWLTGERIPSESWREEAGPVIFYPPYVVAPTLEAAIRRALAFDPASRWATIDELKAELTRLSGSISIRAAAITDVGRIREHNEDSVMAAEYLRESLVRPDQNYLYVVADGMGGAEAGEIASAIAVQSIREYIHGKLGEPPAADSPALLVGALEEANSKIIEYQAAHQESRGMGSTAVAALILPPDAAVAWCGDSRAYLMEGGSLRQITRDHSLVQRLIEIGQITAEEARHHEHKNVITRSLGARQSGPAGAEGVALKLKRGDRLLLCSDGLTTHVEDREIQEVLARHDDPFEAARELIVAANAGGGSDNISVAVVFAS
ncbi:MAG TPA: Stp1/IreP family PP2C-type Ser/Thr phosphatase, partial [Candidatus Binataceae bacterium]|nr:Stp1/IreP family PP2C-type Ser/Thr phosphatase [Candidatus Binataceae bacterium]